MAGDAERELPPTKVEVVSPRDTSSIAQATEGPLASLRSSLEARADPDAQNTVTDFIDFTEYLPADIVRSLTLIGKLDQTYHDASLKVNDLTTTWGRLPSIAARDRPEPAKLRADISEQLDQAVHSRNYAHAEAVRMSQNINRHYQKAKFLFSKLQTMMDNYPTEDQKSSVEPKSPQMVRAKLTVRPTGEGGPKKQRRVPRITVPGEVLAPYDIAYESFSDDSDISSDEDSDTPASRRVPGPPRIKLVASKGGPKTIGRPVRSMSYPSAAMSAAAAANAAALLNPPPPNAPVGSKDAPWLQLTQYELAVLRKRMKKNATWAPSETMIARELKNLGRGPEAYREAKKKAEDEGRVFDPQVPTPVMDDESGTQQLPAGAISADCLAADDIPTSNRGMKLNEAKKLKREALAKMAAEEAEESARKMAAAAKLFLGTKEEEAAKARANSRSRSKRKRDGDGEEAPGTPELTGETPRNAKRTKTETPVPPPRHPSFQQENSANSGNLTPSGGVAPSQTQTPVPIPKPFTRSATSPTPNSGTVTTSVPVKPPAMTPVPLPRPERTVTPVYPPVRDMPTREAKRETRAESEKRAQTPNATGLSAGPADLGPRRSISRGLTPGAEANKRPGSRGKTMSQEPPSLATDRPRRASTARNTPNPESKPLVRRTKRPAPGIVSTTSSGGNSAVGKRKAAPKRKARATKKEKGQDVEIEVEVDDEGNAIDPDEARYCICNGVSFGTMILCDNADQCKNEWFHLECVGLSEIPARTTKWYCPDCRKILNIGERGEVSARGVRK